MTRIPRWAWLRIWVTDPTLDSMIVTLGFGADSLNYVVKYLIPLLRLVNEV